MFRIAVLLLGLGLFLAPSLSAQVESERYRILTTSGERIQVTEGFWTDTSLSGLRNGVSFTVHRNDIRAVERYGGTRAGKGAAIGALMGLTIVISAIIQVSADPNYEVDAAKVVPVTLVLVGAGTVIGAGIGAGMTVWEPTETGGGWSWGYEPPAGPMLTVNVRF